MPKLPRVTKVEHLGGRRLRVTFTDDLVRELDFDGSSGTICWPNGIDLDPDVLHGDHQPASGRPARLIREYRPQQTG